MSATRAEHTAHLDDIYSGWTTHFWHAAGRRYALKRYGKRYFNGTTTKPHMLNGDTLEEVNMYSTAQAAEGSQSEHQGFIAPKQQCFVNCNEILLKYAGSYILGVPNLYDV